MVAGELVVKLFAVKEISSVEFMLGLLTSTQEFLSSFWTSIVLKQDALLT